MKGLGHDVVEVLRIKEAFTEKETLAPYQKALDKIFTEKEQVYCLKHKNPWPHFAGKFAAKEAIVKALGTGFRKGVQFLDIEIDKDSLGKPFPVFSERLKEAFAFPQVLVSITHTKDLASAVAIWY